MKKHISILRFGLYYIIGVMVVSSVARVLLNLVWGSQYVLIPGAEFANIAVMLMGALASSYIMVYRYELPGTPKSIAVMVGKIHFLFIFILFSIISFIIALTVQTLGGLSVTDNFFGLPVSSLPPALVEPLQSMEPLPSASALVIFAIIIAIIGILVATLGAVIQGVAAYLSFRVWTRSTT
jgi:hypothetical protein